VAVTVFDDAEWSGLVRALGTPAWTRDPALATAAGRAAHATAIDAHVAAWIASRPAEAVVETLQAAGVPAGLVADAADLCARDPQLAARGHFVDVPTPEGRTVRIDGPPYRLSATPARVAGPGPLLGEHTDEVLSRVLGLDDAEIARLRADKVVR
jgi:crotonobetainyl-CoA:carnitine CoA-transferase CaiB-like acyl-CoA transferase